MRERKSEKVGQREEKKGCGWVERIDGRWHQERLMGSYKNNRSKKKSGGHRRNEAARRCEGGITISWTGVKWSGRMEVVNGLMGWRKKKGKSKKR